MQLKVPNKTKYKKYHKQQLNLSPQNRLVGTHRAGSCCLVSLEPGRLSARHFDMMRRVVRRTLKKVGKIWCPWFPHFPITAKPLEVRMGKGKGSIKYWAMPVRSGSTLLELGGVTPQQGLKALLGVQKKLPVRSKALFF